MNGIIFHLGRTPELSIAELKSVFCTDGSVLAHGQAFFMDIVPDVAKTFFPELGGVLRAGMVLFRGTLEDALEVFPKKVLEHHIDGKKQKVGLHILPKDRSRSLFHRLFGDLKKQAKEGECSLRVVNRGEQMLDAFAVQKEHLLEEGNGEFWLVVGKDEVILAKTIAIQNPEDFAKRDYGKPERDMQVGMLPPKLAMMMLNLARQNGKFPNAIYDPFCGTGTMLIEAESMGISSIGSDQSKNMVEATRKNAQYFFPQKHLQVFTHDVHNSFPIFVEGKTIVSEGFLGNMYAKPISQEQFFVEKDVLFPLYSQLFKNISIAAMSRIVLAIPFWRGKDRDYSFSKKLLEGAQRYGYESVFSPLLYRRPEQVVGREILVLQRVETEE